VSVLVVLHAEPRDRVERLLRSLDEQQGPLRLEVVIAAPDAEHAMLAGLAGSGAVSTVQRVDNPGGARSAGLNRALARAQGDVVARADARSTLPPHYLARVVARLDADPGVGVVGGVQRPVCAGGGAAARGIARALRNPWLLGGAKYRRPGAGGTADTVYLGAFRAAELRALGGWAERLAANEDFELCARYRAAGAAVFIEPHLEVPYEPRASHPDLWRQYRAFGEAKAAYWREAGQRPNGRQAVALAGALAGAALAWRAPRRGAALAAGALGALGVLDHLVEPAERDLRVRLAAYGAYATFLTAWLAGVVHGVTAGPGPPAG